jgi:hypothetical protein
MRLVYRDGLQRKAFKKAHGYTMSLAEAEPESLLWQRRMVSQQVLTALGGFYSDDTLVARPHQMEMFGGPLDGASCKRWRSYLPARMQARTIQTCRCMCMCTCTCTCMLDVCSWARMHTYVHHVYTQAPGGLKICGYYSKYLAMSEGRHCYFLSIATGGNNCYLLPGLTDPSGVVLTGDKSTSLIKRRRSLYI